MSEYDILKIDTPENVTFDYAISGIGSRFLAALVDALLLGIVEGIILGALIFILVQFESVLNETAQNWIIGGFLFVAFIFFYAYHSFFEILWNGQTPGKRLTGIRVIRLDGTPVAAAEILIRNFVRIADFLPFAYGVGVISMFVNPSSRRLGDLAAGTVVIHDKKPAALTDLSAARVQVGQNALAHLPEGLAVETIEPKDLNLIEEFLSRRENFSNRQALAAHIFQSLKQKYHLDVSPINYEYALEAIHAAAQNRSVEEAPLS